MPIAATIVRTRRLRQFWAWVRTLPSVLDAGLAILILTRHSLPEEVSLKAETGTLPSVRTQALPVRPNTVEYCRIDVAAHLHQRAFGNKGKHLLCNTRNSSTSSRLNSAPMPATSKI